LLNPSSAGTREASGISARYEDASRCNARTRWPSCVQQCSLVCWNIFRRAEQGF